jgi:hypothetical protein
LEEVEIFEFVVWIVWCDKLCFVRFWVLLQVNG